MKKVKFPLVMSMLFLIISCHQNEFGEVARQLDENRLTVEQAQRNALDFVSRLQRQTRSGAVEELRIANVIAYPSDEGGGKLTRSASDTPIPDSLFYFVNFADNKGFVIASADKRQTPVYAYIEEGNYSKAGAENPGFDLFMEGIIEIELMKKKPDDKPIPNNPYDDPPYPGPDTPDTPEAPTPNDDEDHNNSNHNGGYGQGNNPTNSTDMFEVMKPVLVTKWGQWNPYNKYTPPGTPTGCVPTAAAQICSFLRKPSSLPYSFDGTNQPLRIEWDKILAECKSYNGALVSFKTRDQIANLMRLFGFAIDAEYTDKGTSANSNDMINFMQDISILMSNLTDYDPTRILHKLKKGTSIFYMKGCDLYSSPFPLVKKYEGHAWVIDGFIHERKNGQEAVYFHCNWGWYGDKNGYFLSNAFDVRQAAPYNDDAIATRGGEKDYYQYKLKMSEAWAGQF